VEEPQVFSRSGGCLLLHKLYSVSKSPKTAYAMRCVSASNSHAETIGVFNPKRIPEHAAENPTRYRIHSPSLASARAPGTSRPVAAIPVDIALRVNAERLNQICPSDFDAAPVIASLVRRNHPPSVPSSKPAFALATPEHSWSGRQLIVRLLPVQTHSLAGSLGDG
jgi:hypothetical protein